jgi:CMP-N,N'-diacetyllegionaminic acid synthase
MNILITICGRAGSKGVRSKNIRELCGIPLIYYTVATALQFKNNNPVHSVDICVNSDSEPLLQLVRSIQGVTCVKRPEELARDDSPKIPVITHSVTMMEHNTGTHYDRVIDLDITSPLRKVEDIESALSKLESNDAADVVFSVVHARRNPYFNMVETHEGVSRKIIDSTFVTRQQAPQVYDMNASIYCYRRSSLVNRISRSPFDGSFDIVLMQDTAVLDIDSEEDFELMEVLGAHYFQREFRLLRDKASELLRKG